MEYKKAELLSSDVYLVDIRFMKNAHAAANGMWADMIRKCIRSTDADYIINDMVEVPKSLVLDALKDESVCQVWKEKIKEVFNLKNNEYYNFKYEGYKLDTTSFVGPMFVGFDLTPNERLECVLIDLNQWEVHQEEINIDRTPYKKLKFKKK